MKIGVVFPTRFDDPGEFLADARAIETAGVDSVWLHWDDGGLELVLLASMAAVTSQLRLGLIAEGGRGAGFDQRQIQMLQWLSRNRVVESSSERWQPVDVPSDRDAWAATLERAERDGAHGVLVPFGPRLLDILRHPEDAIDRSDLQLAQG